MSDLALQLLTRVEVSVYHRAARLEDTSVSLSCGVLFTPFADPGITH